MTGNDSFSRNNPEYLVSELLHWAQFREILLKSPGSSQWSAKMPIILGKSRISVDFGAVYVGPPIQIEAELGLGCQTE